MGVDPQVCRSEVGRLYQSQCCASQQGLQRQFFKMAKFFFLASLAITSVVSQDRYWGSYSASYPAGGSGSSADVAYDVANLQEASRQALGVASQASAPRAVASQASTAKAVFAPQQQTSFASANQASRPGGYVHNPAGDAGEAYVHDTTGDHGPYYYWKLRQQGKSGVAPTAPTAPAVQAAPAPQRKVVAVRKQRPAAQPAVFNNYPAAPARQQYAQPAPAPQQYYQPAPAPVQQAAPVQNYWQGIADPFQINHGQRSYAYTAPTYSAQAQGTSYSYNAQY